MGLRERRVERVREMAASHMHDGETIKETIPVLDPMTRQGVGILRQLALVMTDSRVLLLDTGRKRNPARAVVETAARDQVRVSGFAPGGAFKPNMIRFAFPGRELTFAVPGVHRDDALAVVEALGGVEAE